MISCWAEQSLVPEQIKVADVHIVAFPAVLGARARPRAGHRAVVIGALRLMEDEAGNTRRRLQLVLCVLVVDQPRVVSGHVVGVQAGNRNAVCLRVLVTARSFVSVFLLMLVPSPSR